MLKNWKLKLNWKQGALSKVCTQVELEMENKLNCIICLFLLFSEQNGINIGYKGNNISKFVSK